MKVISQQKNFTNDFTLVLLNEDQLINMMAYKQKFFGFYAEKPKGQYEIKVTTDMLERDKENSTFVYQCRIFNSESPEEEYSFNISLNINNRTLIMFLKDNNNSVFRLCVKYVYIESMDSSFNSELHYTADPSIDMTTPKDVMDILTVIKNACKSSFSYKNKDNKTIKTDCESLEGLKEIFHTKNIFNWQNPSTIKNNFLAFSFISLLESLECKFNVNELNKNSIKDNTPAGSFKSSNKILDFIKKELNKLGIFPEEIEILDMEEYKERDNETSIDAKITSNPKKNGSTAISNITDSNWFINNSDIEGGITPDANINEETDPSLNFESCCLNNDALTDKICRGCSEFEKCALIQLLQSKGFDFKVSRSISDFLSMSSIDECENALLNMSVAKDERLLMLSLKKKKEE